MFSLFRRAPVPGPAAPSSTATPNPVTVSPAVLHASAGFAQLPAPLELGGVLVELVHVPARRAKRPPKAVVQLQVGQSSVLMHPQEIRALLAGGVGVIDSHPGCDHAFLCDAAGVAAMAAAGTPAEAGEWMAVFPPDALALVTGLAIDEPAAVISGGEKALLGKWLETLPTASLNGGQSLS